MVLMGFFCWLHPIWRKAWRMLLLRCVASFHCLMKSTHSFLAILEKNKSVHIYCFRFTPNLNLLTIGTTFFCSLWINHYVFSRLLHIFYGKNFIIFFFLQPILFMCLHMHSQKRSQKNFLFYIISIIIKKVNDLIIVNVLDCKAV